jgi:glucose/mannose transport system permease protein
MNNNEMVVTAASGINAARIFIYACLGVAAVFYLAPLVVVVLTSLKSVDEVYHGTILSLPHPITTQPWGQALFTACIGVTCGGLAHQFLNSFIMVVPAVILSTAVGTLNGYALTLWTFKGHNFVFGFLLLGMFIPLQVVLIPIAQVLGFFGLSDSLEGLVILHVIYGIPYTTLFFRNYFVSLPVDLIRAARMDGAKFLQVLARVVVPISGPCIVVATIWQFTNIWNDFLLASTFTSGTSVPVTVGLYDLVVHNTGVTLYNVDMAAVLLTAAPTLLVYLVAGRYFVRGLVAGSVKG